MRPPVVLLDRVALREAVINAIIHNDYSYEGVPKFEPFGDRLEITSIGSIPQGMSEAEFFEGYSIPATRNSCAFTHSLPCFFLPAFGSFARIHSYRVNTRKDCHHFHPLIASLIQKPESKTLEFKRDLSFPRPWLKTLVAFANSAGGEVGFRRRR